MKLSRPFRADPPHSRMWQFSDRHHGHCEAAGVNISGFNGLPDTPESGQDDESGHEV